ncbi:ChrR family anti-sigma-E factor [Pseudomonas sp. NPDC089734]|uniref:ChrR family anti-sigma-E factor n=1 Tax=Pseudomonas sp. NPDC089734 TaxID=3364469 RepID=UPI003816D47C
MNPVHHPDEATLISYASGALSQVMSLITAAHLEHCAECRARLRDAERIGGLLMQQPRDTAVQLRGRAAMLARLDELPSAALPPLPAHDPSPDLLPTCLQGHFAASLSEQPWKTLVPGVQRVRARGIRQGNLMLLKIAPGVGLPLHGHRSGEMTLVLKGSYHDQLGDYRPGDLADLDSDTLHQPIAHREEPCICVLATDASLRFQGVIARMLQPIFGI